MAKEKKSFFERLTGTVRMDETEGEEYSSSFGEYDNEEKEEREVGELEDKSLEGEIEELDTDFVEKPTEEKIETPIVSENPNISIWEKFTDKLKINQSFTKTADPIPEETKKIITEFFQKEEAKLKPIEFDSAGRRITPHSEEELTAMANAKTIEIEVEDLQRPQNPK
jgi:hypothetical protein